MATRLDWGILEGSVGPRVRLLRNALSARSIAVSSPHALPTGALTVLALIAANPGSSQTALARRAGLNKSALVGIVDSLERSGLVERDRPIEQRQQRDHVALAERLADRLFAAVHQCEQRLHRPLALGGDRDLVAPPVRRGAPTLDQPALLELVDDPDQRRFVEPGPAGQRGLRAAGIGGDQCQHGQ